MSAAKRPNFLIVVADDLGFSDTGPYGSEIATPTLDRLAREGTLMTGFHTASACSPTRSMLLSGTDNHIAGLGQMAEFMKIRRDYQGRPGYEGYLNYRVAALPEILQDNGYLTIMSGKWHLGLEKEQSPSARGFDKCFTYLAGSGNHFNNEPQLDRDDYGHSALQGDRLWMREDRFLERKKELPKDFYSTKSFTDEMLKYLEGRNAEEREKPFFGYLTYTAPHWPLQAPPEVIAKYRGVYDDGPEGLRQRRLKALIERGLVPADVEPAPSVGEVPKEWDEMDADERAASARKMETYAAMVDQIDAHLARLVAYLERSGELDNTFVLFMSDNGAEGKLLEALPVSAGMPLGDIIAQFYDNSLANIGAANSFVFYGPRWASAATAPSRGFKGWTTEGGIRCPCLVRYPPLMTRGHHGRTTAAQVTHEFTTVMDILPTVLELAGVPHPGATFRGRSVAAPRGRSWATHLRAVMGSSGRGPGPGSPEEGAVEESSVHGEETHVHGWELFGQRAMREGPWKIVWMPSPRGRDAWELYHVERDPAELHDLAGAEPEVLARLLRHWEVYFAETGMVEYPGASARAGTQVS